MNGHSPSEHSHHSTNPDAAPHLLLVEDEAALSQALVQTLKTHLPAVNVTAVSSVEQAWRTVQEGDVRLLITDVISLVYGAGRSFNTSGNGAGTGWSS